MYNGTYERIKEMWYPPFKDPQGTPKGLPYTSMQFCFLGVYLQEHTRTKLWGQPLESFYGARGMITTIMNFTRGQQIDEANIIWLWIGKFCWQINLYLNSMGSSWVILVLMKAGFSTSTWFQVVPSSFVSPFSTGTHHSWHSIILSNGQLIISQ